MGTLLLGPVLRYVDHTTAAVWMKLDRRCRVEVELDADGTGAGPRAATSSFEVAGHHFGFVELHGLEPGGSWPYRVLVDGEQVWPPPRSAWPPSRIRTTAPGRPVRLTFGSCRSAGAEVVDEQHSSAADALDCFGRRVAGRPEEELPDLLLMLGDQVYADELSPVTRERIAARRDLGRPPGAQVEGFEEYTWLYDEAWSEPPVRWLLSTVPVAMMFDDHDVHDDWNTSATWRDGVLGTDWWAERITAGLVSYWVFQHLGNLSPAARDTDPLVAELRAAARSGADLWPVLSRFAADQDAACDTPDPTPEGAPVRYRWSFTRDLGPARLVVLDSRCGRVLRRGDGSAAGAGERAMLTDDEFDRLADDLDADAAHLLVATSVPWLLAPALHAVETAGEQWAGSQRPALARLGERLRQGLDLEHWAAFRGSFDRLADLLLGRAQAGPDGRRPVSVCVLSGDVHHSYASQLVARRRWRRRGGGPRPAATPVLQLTCSPMHNRLSPLLGWTVRVAWWGWVGTLAGVLLRPWLPGGPPLQRLISRPEYRNAIATLTLDDDRGRFVLEAVHTAGRTGPAAWNPAGLVAVADLDLSAPVRDRRRSSTKVPTV